MFALTPLSRRLFRPTASLARMYAAKAGEGDAAKSGEGDPAKSSEGDTASSEGTDPKATKESEIAALEAKLAELTKEVGYARADYVNLARLGDAEKAKAADMAIRSFAADMITVDDQIESALLSVPKPEDDSTPLGSLYAGVELTRKALLQTFEYFGVAPMSDPVGLPYDSHLQEANYVPGEGKPGEVIKQTQDGWMFKGRVLRTAKVDVAKE